MILRTVEAFVLAGGKSSRMGTSKGLLEVGGSPILSRVLDVLQPLFPKVTIVSNTPGEVESFGFPIISDQYTDCGPMGGLHAALQAARSHTIFVVSWDLPFMTPIVVHSLALRHAAGPVTIAVTHRALHPLIGFYNTSILGVVEKRLKARQLGMQLLVHEINARMLDVSDLNPHHSGVELFNVNTPADLDRARRIAIEMRTSGAEVIRVA